MKNIQDQKTGAITVEEQDRLNLECNVMEAVVIGATSDMRDGCEGDSHQVSMGLFLQWQRVRALVEEIVKKHKVRSREPRSGEFAQA